MIYRKGELSPAMIDRGWPNQVALPASANANGGYQAIHAFCKDLSLSPRGHSVFHEGAWFNVYCFAEALLKRDYTARVFCPKGLALTAWGPQAPQSSKGHFDHAAVTLRRRPPVAFTRALLTVLMDVHKDSHQVQRLEVVERGRRRRWSESEKLTIIDAKFERRRPQDVCLQLRQRLRNAQNVGFCLPITY